MGLEPVQRQGLEYEFDLVCSMDDENNLVIDKTRCSVYSQEKIRLVPKPNAAYFQPFIQWLDGPAVEKENPAPAPAATPKPAQSALPVKPWSNAGQMRRLFAQVREQIGEVAYLGALHACGVRSVDDFFTMRPVLEAAEKALACYQSMLEIAREEVA